MGLEIIFSGCHLVVNRLNITIQVYYADIKFLLKVAEHMKKVVQVQLTVGEGQCRVFTIFMAK
jgi:hypothetical protein